MSKLIYNQFKQLEKAKEAKSAEELLLISKENGVIFTMEQAEMYYELLNPEVGAVSEEGLDNIKEFKSVKTVEEILTLAKEYGFTLTEVEPNTYYGHLLPRTDAVCDEEPMDI